MARFYAHPWRHYWPLPDGRTIVWSPALAETAALEDASLWPLLQQMRTTTEAEGDLEVVARFLQRQGYLLDEPWTGSKLPAPHGVRFWEGFDLKSWLEPRLAKGEFHLFPGDGQENGWCFWTGVTCLRCQVLRWLANRGLSQSVDCLRAVAEVPRWEPLSPRALEMVELALERRCSVVWQSERHWLCRPSALPQCLCQGWSPLSESIPDQTDRWEWTDPLGVVCQSHCDSSSIQLWGARSGQIGLLGGADPDRSEGAGCHVDSVTAYWRAVGESLERYCARWLPPAADDELPILRWKEFSAQQLRGGDFPYHESSKLSHWCQVRHLGNGEVWRAPAQAVMLCPVPGERADYPDLSHGLCCHRTLEQAVWGALWECLERDAVAGWWAQLCGSRAQALRRESELELYEIGCLAGRCAVAFAVDAQGRRAAGTAATLSEACFEKAIEEAQHNFRILSRRTEPVVARGRPASFTQHLETYWAEPQRFPSAKLKKLGSKLPPSVGESTAEGIARHLEGKGIHLYWTELTTPDVVGFHVVKVFSPQLLYLPANHGHWPLGRARYRQLVGHNQEPSLPHPFA